jgi:hypothetical protein
MRVSHDFKQTMVESNIWGAIRVIWVWVWHWGRAISTFLQRGKVEAKWRFPRVVVDWLPPGSTVESEAEAECQIWLDRQARIKWFGPNKHLFHWSLQLSLFDLWTKRNGMTKRNNYSLHIDRPVWRG